MPMPDGAAYTNTVEMRLVRIEPGTFTMGTSTPLPDELVRLEHRRNGDPDERPAHEVRINRALYMGETEVTNAQYEEFDPKHRRLRGKLGFSKDDDEAVVFVSWDEATAFCEWLSEREGLPYRLPTEAEWEYSCRAGTDTPFSPGDAPDDSVMKNQRASWYPCPRNSKPEEVQPLHVGRSDANAWGVRFMHGNVEEWCSDWYGPYEPKTQRDPVGRAKGEFRVTRGGSHGTEVYFLRSANRMGTLPDERSWYIGFRVVLGEAPKTKPLPAPKPELHQQGVKPATPRDITRGPDPGEPHFQEPKEFVRIPDGSDGPIYSKHNHVPALVECPNGDLLAAWYSCIEEPGREVSLAASRLRFGEEEWEDASLFWDAPDRTETSNALFADDDGTIYNFIGLSAAATWGNTCVAMRRSTDSGRTWTKARIIRPEHGQRNMPIDSVIKTSRGDLVLPCDADSSGNGGTAIHVSRDNGETWADPGSQTAGIHAGIVELDDGRLMAFGRGDNVDGMMPRSISDDMGESWTVTASEFPPISGGQRLVLKRLEEGPLLFCSFGNIQVTDSTGAERPVQGLFAAVSHDEGETWPMKRLISHGGPPQQLATMDGTPFTMTHSMAEPRGYLTGWQARNGVIHLISSRLHYAFNLKWLQTPPPPAASEE